MATRKLTPPTLEKLRVFEKQLTDAVDSGEADRALALVARIQGLFSGDRRHHRLLRAKLQAFEACLDTNRLQYAREWFSWHSEIGEAVDSPIFGGIHPARRMPSAQEGNTGSQTSHTRGLQENKQHSIQSDPPGVPKEDSQPHRGGEHPGQFNRHSKGRPTRRESNRKRSRTASQRNQRQRNIQPDRQQFAGWWGIPAPGST